VEMNDVFHARKARREESGCDRHSLKTVTKYLPEKRHLGLLVITIAILLDGCTSDPMATLFKQNGGFALVRPPSDRAYIGDVYDKPGGTEIIAMDDVLTKDALQASMQKVQANVDVAQISGTKSYSLDVHAAYIGYVEAALSADGASSYTISVQNPHVYAAAVDSNLKPVYIAAIKKAMPSENLKGRYIISGLFSVDGLKYDFYKKDGSRIDLSIEPGLSKEITAGLSGSFTVSQTGSLEITAPRYVGYRMVEVTKDDATGVTIRPRGFTLLSAASLNSPEIQRNVVSTRVETVNVPVSDLPVMSLSSRKTESDN
jgi:hypothetical protein